MSLVVLRTLSRLALGLRTNDPVELGWDMHRGRNGFVVASMGLPRDPYRMAHLRQTLPLNLEQKIQTDEETR